MHDVARAANCSQSTVSAVLNWSEIKISMGTKRRVLEAAIALNYPSPSIGLAVLSLTPLNSTSESAGDLGDDLSTFEALKARAVELAIENDLLKRVVKSLLETSGDAAKPLQGGVRPSTDY